MFKDLKLEKEAYTDKEVMDMLLLLQGVLRTSGYFAVDKLIAEQILLVRARDDYV